MANERNEFKDRVGRKRQEHKLFANTSDKDFSQAYKKIFGLYEKEQSDKVKQQNEKENAEKKWQPQDCYVLPKRWSNSGDNNFYFELKNSFDKYCEDVKNCLGTNGNEAVNKEDIKKLHDICDLLLRAVNQSLHGYPAQAYGKMKELMELYNDDKLVVRSNNEVLLSTKVITNDKNIGDNENKSAPDSEEKYQYDLEYLYRVRNVSDNRKYTRDDIFHTPYHLCSKIATTRYSIPGFPCLYLATNIPLCMSEAHSGDNKANNVLASRFAVNKYFDIYDLGNKPEKLWEKVSDNNDTELIDYCRKYILWFPLQLACSYVRIDRNDAFAPEYIVPQLFLQWVRTKAKNELVAVRYFSCLSQYYSELGMNYAFPASGDPILIIKDKDEELKPIGFCPVLENSIDFTEPQFSHDFEKPQDLEKSLISLHPEQLIKDKKIKNIKKIEIPANVLSIGAFAFDGCTKATSLNLNKVESIGACAFDGCASLQSITIPDSVTSIGWAAFAGCTSLQSITIPDSVTSIGDYAFNGCKSLQSITIPDSVTSIGDFAFDGCKSLQSITIPDSVTSIGNGVFSGCESLPSITIPDSVTSIGDYAFGGCESLSSITIPDSVTSIGDEAFSGCASLQSITIPSSVTSIGDLAFDGCTSLQSIKIPDSVTSIGLWAFDGCESLQSIKIPDSVTSIGEFAFSGCKSLQSIEIPDSVTSIGLWAFDGCESLRSVVYNGTQSDWNNIKIGEDAFDGCHDVAVYCTDGEIAINPTEKKACGCKPNNSVDTTTNDTTSDNPQSNDTQSDNNQTEKVA